MESGVSIWGIMCILALLSGSIGFGLIWGVRIFKAVEDIGDKLIVFLIDSLSNAITKRREKLDKLKEEGK